MPPTSDHIFLHPITPMLGSLQKVPDVGNSIVRESRSTSTAHINLFALSSESDFEQKDNSDDDSAKLDLLRNLISTPRSTRGITAKSDMFDSVCCHGLWLDLARNHARRHVQRSIRRMITVVFKAMGLIFHLEDRCLCSSCILCDVLPRSDEKIVCMR